MTAFFGLGDVEVEVADLARSLRIYHEATEFPIKARGEGWVVIDANGAGAIRLIEVPRPESRARLRLLVPDVAVALDALVSAGAKRVKDATRTPGLELVGVSRDPDGNIVQVYRPLTEDEYDFEPEIPKEMTWDPEAEALLKSLLKSVPILFRALARRKVTRVAEELAERTRRVTREEVIRGTILASAKVTRSRNRQPLIEHGIDVDKYQADWDAD